MDIRTFAEKVTEIIKNRTNNVEVNVREVVKNNGIKYTGITIKEIGNNIAPTIYINEYYKSEKTPAETATYVINTYEEHKIDENVNVDWFKIYELVKTKLKAKLVNAENTQYAGVSAKRYGYDDLKIVPYVNVGEIGTITILPEHIKMWNVKIQTIVSDALKNMEEDITMQSLANFMETSMGFEEGTIGDSPLNNILIVSNKTKINGAIAAITARKMLKEKYNGNYVVLPSSIHEVLVLENNEDLEEMTEMVKAVNSQCVAPEDRLSDKAYLISA